MDDSVQRQPRSAVPQALVGAVVLIAMIELWLGRLELHLRHFEAANHRFPRTVFREAAGAQLLCFGDSLVKQGIVPRILEEKLGTTAYNLAVGGGTPAANYFVLRQALEAGVRPKWILVDFEPVMISIGANHSERRLAEMASIRDCLDIGWHYRSPDYFGALAMAWVLPSVRYRTEIRGLVATSLSGETDADKERVSTAWKLWGRERGVHLNPSLQTDPRQSPLWNNRYARHMPRKCDWRSEHYITRFFSLAEAHNIPVYWLLPPVHPEIRSSWDAGGGTEFYTRFAERMQNRFTGVTIVDARRSGCPAERFYDSCHLDGSGASAFTEQVAEVLNRYPPRPGAAGGWVNVSADRIEAIVRSPARTDRAY